MASVTMTFKWRQGAREEIERKICNGLEANGYRGKAIAQPLTPVKTGWAQRSEHVVVQNSKGVVVGGDKTDGNGQPAQVYPSKGRPTVFLGSNTKAKPYKFTSDEGYFLGLEMGVLSTKGSNMFGRGMAAMIANIHDDLRSNW
jgi:hypothetical protein